MSIVLFSCGNTMKNVLIVPFVILFILAKLMCMSLNDNISNYNLERLYYSTLT